MSRQVIEYPEQRRYSKNGVPEKESQRRRGIQAPRQPFSHARGLFICRVVQFVRVGEQRACNRTNEKDNGEDNQCEHYRRTTGERGEQEGTRVDIKLLG